MRALSHLASHELLKGGGAENTSQESISKLNENSVMTSQHQQLQSARIYRDPPTAYKSAAPCSPNTRINPYSSSNADLPSLPNIVVGRNLQGSATKKMLTSREGNLCIDEKYIG